MQRSPVAQLPPPLETTAPLKLSQHDALRQIALIEQQARLQTSLDLMPADDWYAGQRKQNEAILTTLREATTAKMPGETL